MAFGAHNWNTHKHTPNEHVKQELCETSEKFWRNDKDLNFYLFQEPEVAQKLGFWGQHQTHLGDINKHRHSIISYTAN